MGKILIADDSSTDLQNFVTILKDTGHTLVTAMDGIEAEEKAVTEQFDLIILDIIMPNKNGFEVCRDLKKYDRYKNIPIIMVTGKAEEYDKFWGIKQGADEYITKPFEPKELLMSVKKYLK